MNAPAQQYKIAPIDSIVPGVNVRHRPLDEGKLAELVESVRSHGILEPILVRPKGDDLELVFGFRRFTAAQKAGLADVPVLVRVLADDQVLELQLAENIDRADMHPLDEADGFARLMKFPGYDVQRIADKMGRPASYVAQRLKLCTLGKKSREALDQGDITLAVALLLARIPVEKLQDEALNHITDGGLLRDGVMKASEAAKVIEEHFMLRLSEAPFDITDAKLVPKAGACSTCPKRTGAQSELFADVKSPDLCTDPTCHRAKVDAFVEIRVKAHKADGGEVLSQKDSKALLGHSWTKEGRELQEQYQCLDKEEFIGTSGKRKKLRSLFGKELPPITLARDPESGALVELVPRKDAEAVLRKARNEKEPTRATNKLTPSQKRAREEDRRQAEIHRAVIAEMVAKAETYFDADGVPGPMAQILVQAAAESLWNETISKAASRRGMPEPKRKGGLQSYRSPNVDRIRAWSDDQPAPVLLGLLLELLVGRDARDDGDTAFKRALKVLGVDAKEVARAVLSKPRGKAAKAVADDQVEAAELGDSDEGDQPKGKRTPKGKPAKSKAKRKPPKAKPKAGKRKARTQVTS
jgi:ParB/RepB/Spo0J family partition protein